MTGKVLKRITSAIVSVTTAIAAFPAIPASAETGATTYTCSGYDVEYTVKSEWESGQAVEVKITNTGEESILNWAFMYDAAGEINSIWNADIYDCNETTYVVKNCGWNYEIQPEQSVVFGYNLVGSELTVPTAFELYSKRCDITEGYDVQLNITGEWETGLQGEIVLTNTSEQPIEAWELSFDSSFTINNLWNGRITANEIGRYSIASQSWTNPIAAGESVTVGFTGSKTVGTETAISNYTLESVVLDELEKEINWEDDTDTDSDGIPDVYETNLTSTDPQNADTDGDGLTDYQEIYLTRTDPLVYNSVTEGMSDADTDCDGDGLSNIDEITRETDPLNTDTDGDSLSDYDEANVYGTDPLKFDTDDDRLYDGDELSLSTDPLNSDTDSDGILDGDEYYTVEVDETRIDSSLLTDNEAIPSLTVTAQGNANSEIEVSEYIGNEQSDELCIGKTIVISGTEIESGVLTFNVTNTAAFEEYEYADGIIADSVVICYNNGSETTPVLTSVNRETNTISAEISGTGTYFITNLAGVVETWGVPVVETILNETNDFDYELGGQADIVFVIDVTGSMYGAINSVKKYISSFSEQIESTGVHPSYALVQYGDIIYDGVNSTKVIKNGSSNWFKDASSLKNGLNSLTMTNGGDIAECAIDGLAAAAQLDMRPSAEKCFVLITDANYKIKNQYGYSTDVSLFNALADKDINVSVVTGTQYYSTYNNLVTATGGNFYNIRTDFSTELLKISNFITDKAKEGYWIALNGLLPYVVKLKGDPNGAVSFDTDEDELPDSDELNEKAVFELNLFVKAACDACGVDYESSDWCYPDVEVYNYTSNPVTEDSDGDGLLDGKRVFYNGKVLLPIDSNPLTYDGPTGVWHAQKKQVESGNIATEYTSNMTPKNDKLIELSSDAYELVNLLLDNNWIANENFIDSVEFLFKGSAESELSAVEGADFLDFNYDSINMAYHSDKTNWQRAFGYNDVYDRVFEFGSDMNKNKFEFLYKGQGYILWSWKGDYWNLQSGSETGLYVYDRTVNGIDHFNVVDYELPMTLSLYNVYRENVENVFSWVPSEEQWWITGFNPKYTAPDPDIMTMICSVDFSEKQDMYYELKETYDPDKAIVIFDDIYHTVWIVWAN